MSILGQPPKDLAVSNLAVSGTLTTSQLSVNNLSVASINGVTADVLVGDVIDTTNGLNAGSWSYSSGIVEFSVIVNANPTAFPLSAGTVFAALSNYTATKAYTFPAFVYAQSAATIAEAGSLVNIIINENGQVVADTDLKENSLVQSAGAYYATVF
jgi:hypothetical protein